MGDKVAQYRSSRDRVASIILRAGDIEVLAQAEKTVASTLRIKTAPA
ncbi:hypothetical protein [Glycomyces buryatensis]|nr:hypothetical protein [Glycomyces buryatensis]